MEKLLEMEETLMNENENVIASLGGFWTWRMTIIGFR
jgi:hypothetical protein